eukprot:359989_1
MANTGEAEESRSYESERLYIQRYAKYSCCVHWSSELVTCFIFSSIIAGSWIWFHVGGRANVSEYSQIGALLYRNWKFVTNNIMLPDGIEYMYSEIWDLILIYYLGSNHLDYNWNKFSIIPRSLISNAVESFYIVRDATWNILPQMNTHNRRSRFRSMLTIGTRVHVRNGVSGYTSQILLYDGLSYPLKHKSEHIGLISIVTDDSITDVEEKERENVEIDRQSD